MWAVSRWRTRRIRGQILGRKRSWGSERRHIFILKSRDKHRHCHRTNHGWSWICLEYAKRPTNVSFYPDDVHVNSFTTVRNNESVFRIWVCSQCFWVYIGFRWISRWAAIHAGTRVCFWRLRFSGQWWRDVFVVFHCIRLLPVFAYSVMCIKPISK